MVQPLGILRSGPSAFADDRGTVAPVGVEWTMRWWVAGEDRWHRPDADAAVRQRLIDDTPVVETAVRVPGGDATGLAYAFAAQGAAALAGRVTNASPVPIAVAFVVGPAASVVVQDSLVVVDGRHAVHLSRRPSSTASAATLDELSAALPGATTVTKELSGYCAIVMPLPHTQAVSWQVTAAGDDAAVAPEPEQVAAGWVRHAEEGAQLVVPPSAATAFSRARHLVAMGAVPGAPVVEVAEHVVAAVALGWFDAALDGTERLAGGQRGRGRIGDDEYSTAAALTGLSAWRRAGIPADRIEHLVGPVVSATRWLSRRRDRIDPSSRSAVDDALADAAAFLCSVDQQGIADHVEKSIALEQPDDDQRIWSDTSPVTVSGLVDALVDDDCDGLSLLSGWSPKWGREPIEANGVPTPWGTLSFALRWHGVRPALLWEVEQWPDVVRSEPVLRSPRLDEGWRGSGWRGEALLAEPPAATPATAAALGESFS
jgi:hypothetical protein